MNEIIPAGKMSDVAPIRPEMGGDQPAGVLEVTLRWSSGERTLKALIDTGAIQAAIPEHLAREFGWNLGSPLPQPTMGFGGSPTIWLVGGVTVEWADQVLATSVAVLGGPPGPVVLGQRDLLSLFNVEFRLGEEPPTIRISDRAADGGS